MSSVRKADLLKGEGSVGEKSKHSRGIQTTGGTGELWERRRRSNENVHLKGLDAKRTTPTEETTAKTAAAPSAVKGVENCRRTGSREEADISTSTDSHIWLVVVIDRTEISWPHRTQPKLVRVRAGFYAPDLKKSLKIGK